MDRMNEIGFYTLAGAPRTPRDLIAEVQEAEAMGLGSAFISERFNVKEAATLSGAVGAVSGEIGMATSSGGHCRLRNDHAPAGRRSVFAGPGARNRPHVQRLRTVPHHDGAD